MPRGTFPGQPVGISNPLPYPPGSPWYPPVGSPGGPGIPVVQIPGQPPGNFPFPPSNPSPNPNPGNLPTIPVGHPQPTTPGGDSTDYWKPWPLPPRSNQTASRHAKSQSDVSLLSDSRVTNQRDLQDFQYTSTQLNSGDFVNSEMLIGAEATPAQEMLKYRGGKTIAALSYVNLYVSGDREWSKDDVERIDRSLSAAMRDEGLNNVLRQYFENQPLRSTALPSHPLVGYTPDTVSRGDIDNFLTYLDRQGYLRSFDLSSTAFNLLLPPGTVLTTESQPANRLQQATDSFRRTEAANAASDADDPKSTQGLAGYHGSVPTEGGRRIYFSVCVYSKRYSNGATNGIPVFDAPWKNVVAALYHQLIEVRTDPDVEEVLRNADDSTAERYLGWVSESGLEIGDLPIRGDMAIPDVFREVSLTDGSGVVPIQLPHSNIRGGPEGPISQPHPLP
ncbi:MAG: hypothetical protein ACK526_02665 [Planctomyces sp.]